MNPTDQPEAFEALLEFLRRNRGFDFTGYKRASLMRRVTKRMQEVHVQGYAEYLDHLEVHPEEFAPLFNTILVNVTAFFRDGEAWEFVAQAVVPRIIERIPENEPIRVWSAGCASGEEPFTIAMILSEALGAERFQQRVKIYATDIDDDALNQARQAIYPTHALETVPAALRDKYFAAANGARWAFSSELRRAVIFGKHDIVQHAPISRLDLLVCRNVLMYLNSETQSRVLSRFRFALNDTGYLFLGRAEMLLTHSALFQPFELKHRVFIKLPNVNGRNEILAAPQNQTADIKVLRRGGADGRLLEAAMDGTPAARMILDQIGVLIFANQAARLLFGLRPVDLGRPFHDLEVSYRPVELRSLIDRALAERHPISMPNVKGHGLDGNVSTFDVQVIPLLDPVGSALGISIQFEDVTRVVRLQEELRNTNTKLEIAYEELQSSNEELETTNEELQSSNEELETTNEELQSSNEELETMNEELQSSNVELQTLNDELRVRGTDLDEANSFLASILAGLHCAVVVVDENDVVQTWNRKAEDLWGLRQDEVQGQHLFSLDIGLPVDRLRTMVRDCVGGQGNEEGVALDATNRRGKAIRCRVSCSPRICADGKHLGSILLMEEIETL